MIVGGQRDAPIAVKRMRSPMVNTIFMGNEYLRTKGTIRKYAVGGPGRQVVVIVSHSSWAGSILTIALIARSWGSCSGGTNIFNDGPVCAG